MVMCTCTIMCTCTSHVQYVVMCTCNTYQQNTLLVDALAMNDGAGLDMVSYRSKAGTVPICSENQNGEPKLTQNGEPKPKWRTKNQNGEPKPKWRTKNQNGEPKTKMENQKPK